MESVRKSLGFLSRDLKDPVAITERSVESLLNDLLASDFIETRTCPRGGTIVGSSKFACAEDVTSKTSNECPSTSARILINCGRSRGFQFILIHASISYQSSS